MLVHRLWGERLRCTQVELFGVYFKDDSVGGFVEEKAASAESATAPAPAPSPAEPAKLGDQEWVVCWDAGVAFRYGSFRGRTADTDERRHSPNFDDRAKEGLDKGNKAWRIKRQLLRCDLDACADNR